MPEEYRNAKVWVHCNDCEQKSKVPFHVMGGKCGNCRSYNTMRDKGELIYDDEDNEEEEEKQDEEEKDDYQETGQVQPSQPSNGG